MTAPDEKKLRYDAIAFQIAREDELAGKRLTWIVTINGFLFAALGFSAGKDSPDQAILALLKFALPVTGSLVSIAGLMGVIAAYIQLQYLTKLWERLDDPRWPRPYGDKKHSYKIGVIPSVLPPLVLAGVWAALFWMWP